MKNYEQHTPRENDELRTVSHSLHGIIPKNALRILLLQVVILLVGIDTFGQQSAYILPRVKLPETVVAVETGEIIDSTERDIKFREVAGLIVFPALIEGEPTNLVLDSGAPGLILHHSDTSQQPLMGGGLSGDLRFGKHKVDRLRIGAHEQKEVTVGLADFSVIIDLLEMPITGILGLNQLKTTTVSLDFTTHSLTFFPISKTGYRWQSPLEVVDHLCIISFTVGERDMRFILDTGSEANLIDKRLLVHLNTKKTGRSLEIQGLDGQLQYSEYHMMDGLTIDGKVFPDLEVAPVDLDYVNSHLEKPISGILGMRFLRHGRIAFDFLHNQFHFDYITPEFTLN